ncbi:MAG: hypothetical protein H6573_36240 [Lewinellaceae bacterium]|nr:hypothetical protein [Lewinellaceae bacterium]
MKTIIRVLALGGLFFLFAVPLCFGQSPTVDTTGVSGWNPFEEPVTIENLMKAYHAIFGALVILWGYLARLFGWNTKKVPFVFVVVAGGAVIAGAFVALGLAKAAPLIITFFLSLGLFDTFLKPGEKAIVKSFSNKPQKESVAGR